VPSRALLAARHVAQPAGRFPGLAPAEVAVGFPVLIGGKDALAEQTRAERYTDLAADYGWEIAHGTAAFTGNGDGPGRKVALERGRTRRPEAAHLLVATSSAPWAPPGARPGRRRRPNVDHRARGWCPPRVRGSARSEPAPGLEPGTARLQWGCFPPHLAPTATLVTLPPPACS